MEKLSEILNQKLDDYGMEVMACMVLNTGRGWNNMEYELKLNDEVVAQGEKGLMKVLFDRIYEVLVDGGFAPVKLNEVEFGATDGSGVAKRYKLTKKGE